MWSTEKLVTEMDAGHEYINALVSLCLLEFVVNNDGKQVKVYDVLQDPAILYRRK